MSKKGVLVAAKEMASNEATGRRFWRLDIQHNDTLFNNNWQNNAQHEDTQ
jgi:hypothetical protein